MAICYGSTSTTTAINPEVKTIFTATINNIIIKQYNTDTDYIFIDFNTSATNSELNTSVTGNLTCKIDNNNTYTLSTLSQPEGLTKASFNPASQIKLITFGTHEIEHSFSFTLYTNINGVQGGNQTKTLGSSGADSGTTTFTVTTEALGTDNSGLSDSDCEAITGTTRENLPIPVLAPTTSTPDKGYFTPQNEVITTTATANGGDFEGIRARAYAVYDSLKNTTAKNIMSDANISSQFNPTTFSAVNFNNYAKPLNAVYNVLNSNSTDSEIVNLNTISSTAATSAKNRILNNGEYNQYSKILALADYATILNYWLKDKISSPINWPISESNWHDCTNMVAINDTTSNNQSHYIHGYDNIPLNWRTASVFNGTLSVPEYNHENAASLNIDNTSKSQVKYTNLNLNNYKICHIKLKLNVPEPREQDTGTFFGTVGGPYGLLTIQLYINNNIIKEITNTSYGTQDFEYYIIISTTNITSIELKSYFNAQTCPLEDPYENLYHYVQDETQMKIETLEFF